MYNFRAGAILALNMKKVVFLLLSLVFLIPAYAEGHMLGQLPYLKIDGVFTDLYPVPTTSLADFYLPQDIATGSAFINKALNFEIDTQALPMPPEVLDKSKFSWEFGNGEKAEGIRVVHTYNKIGTYFAEVKVDSGTGFGGAQNLQSTAINVLPNENYKLPKAVIEVNGKTAQDPLLDIIDVNFSKKQTFSAKKSEAGSSPITEYIWDLGDGTQEDGLEISYQYKENPYTVFPVLRVKTEDGFISDAYLQIKDESAFEDNSTFSKENIFKFLGVIFLSALIAGVLTFLIYRFFLKKRLSK